MIASSNGRFGFNFASGYLFEERKEQMAEVIKQSQFIFCNKDESYDCVKYMWKDLGLQQGEKDR